MPSFVLQPFTHDEFTKGLQLSCNLDLKKQDLAFEFLSEGNIGDVLWPKPVKVKSNIVGLYDETCFELFLKHSQRQNYIEINLSPSDAWCVFALRAYREFDVGKKKFPCAKFPGSFSFTRSSKGAKLTGKILLKEFNFNDMPLQIGVAAVIAQNSKPNVKTYWAARHSAEKPDFHDPHTFVAL